MEHIAPSLKHACAEGRRKDHANPFMQLLPTICLKIFQDQLIYVHDVVWLPTLCLIAFKSTLIIVRFCCMESEIDDIYILILK